MAQTTAAGGYYPPVGFHFKVEFVGIGNDNDVRFQAVSGLSIEFDTEAFKEGGENRFEHTLPVRTKYPDLSLKRGMLTDSKVIDWCLDAFQNRVFNPVHINIVLLNEEHQPLKTWNVYNAWPKKWSVSDLNAQDNSIVIETLDISYNYFTVN
ncbi:phage tail protein [Mucilaginibacter jinjuensis]|uniref:Phage tail protein n=1 Tax=Mucilaginibacter jinjuensis TaxID=1176721 RepID=A0ABY7T1W1_9SPHI|nr:phage tail protein [Mucilaginibacter jinjuensis]WCT10381.1 phage tail protein [Mucilaginibacter jinjuensis]